MRLRASIVLLAVFLAVPSAHAQAPIALTLDEAIARGLEASQRLAEIDASREAAVAATDGREAADRPIVSLQAGYTRTNHVTEFSVPSLTGPSRVLYPDVPDNFRSRVDLQWPIYTSGRTDALVRAARAEVDALVEDRAAARADLTLDITRVYWALVTARTAVQVLELALARMDAHLADVRTRLEVGLVPPNDLLSTQAQHARQQMLLIEARHQVEAVAVDLRRLTGLEPDTPIEIEIALAPPVEPAVPAGAQVDRARAERPERRALGIRIQGALERETAARSGHLPSMAIVGGYDYARPNPRIFPRANEWEPSWDLGVTVHWSLWDGGRVDAEAAEAAAGRRAIEARRREFDEQLDADVRQRRLDLASALEAIAAAEAGVLSAADARRVVNDRFAAGVATNTDALDAQLVLMQAELDRTRALANARLAAARLDRALGR